jgi:hypothetical protein
MSEEIKFCPLLTVVKAGQANYMVCQTNCVFYLESECAFITSAKVLKEVMNPKVIDIIRKEQKDESSF